MHEVRHNEVKPNATRVAVLRDARVNELQCRAAQTAARAAGLQLLRLLVNNANDIPTAIAEATHRRLRAIE